MATYGPWNEIPQNQIGARVQDRRQRAIYGAAGGDLPSVNDQQIAQHNPRTSTAQGIGGNQPLRPRPGALTRADEGVMTQRMGQDIAQGQGPMDRRFWTASTDTVPALPSPESPSIGAREQTPPIDLSMSPSQRYGTRRFAEQERLLQEQERGLSDRRELPVGSAMGFFSDIGAKRDYARAQGQRALDARKKDVADSAYIAPDPMPPTGDMPGGDYGSGSLAETPRNRIIGGGAASGYEYNPDMMQYEGPAGTMTYEGPTDVIGGRFMGSQQMMSDANANMRRGGGGGSFSVMPGRASDTPGYENMTPQQRSDLNVQMINRDIAAQRDLNATRKAAAYMRLPEGQRGRMPDDVADALGRERQARAPSQPIGRSPGKWWNNPEIANAEFEQRAQERAIANLPTQRERIAARAEQTDRRGQQIGLMRDAMDQRRRASEFDRTMGLDREQMAQEMAIAGRAAQTGERHRQEDRLHDASMATHREMIGRGTEAEQEMRMRQKEAEHYDTLFGEKGIGAILGETARSDVVRFLQANPHLKPIDVVARATTFGDKWDFEAFKKSFGSPGTAVGRG